MKAYFLVCLRPDKENLIWNGSGWSLSLNDAFLFESKQGVMDWVNANLPEHIRADMRVGETYAEKTETNPFRRTHRPSIR